MLLIYTAASSSRLRYTFDLFFRELMGCEYKLIHVKEDFIAHQGPKLNYSETLFGGELFLYSSRLLFEKGIRSQEISVMDWQNTKALFATHPRYALPFDPFAATFYLVSRYEEYLPHRRDLHDRYDPRESLAFQKGFLHQPVVNLYAQALKKVIQDQYPELEFKSTRYQFLPTLDIDNAWAYKEKGLIRITGATLRSLLRFDFAELTERFAVLMGQKKDPYDTYELLNTLQQQYNLKYIFFFLLGDYADNDKNVSISRRKFQSLIQSIADYHEVGIHPSYLSNAEPQRVKLEQSRLEKVIKKNVSKSRQHFLRLRFPSTYRNLIDCDITDDYTMGYAQEIGFRAGICSSFLFYDLELEKITTLRIHPFAVMDATLNLYMKINPREAMSYVGPLIREVKAVNGTFTLLWHNESLGDKKPWEGWREVFEEIVRAAKS